jgi:hypothetical protein
MEKQIYELKKKDKNISNLCKPIITYIIEIRAETTITKRLIRTTEIRILRCIADNILRDRIRNEHIHSICEIQDVIMNQNQETSMERLCKQDQ